MTKYLTDKTIDKIIRLRQSGVRAREIAKRLGLHKSTVFRHINLSGAKIIPHKPGPARKRLSADQMALLKNMTKDGYTLQTIWDSVGASERVIRRHQQRLGLESRLMIYRHHDEKRPTRRMSITTAKEREIVELTKKGLTNIEISAKVACHRTTVRRYQKLNNVWGYRYREGLDEDSGETALL